MPSDAKRAYLAGREMIWPVVAERYMVSLERAKEKRAAVLRPGSVTDRAGS